MTYKFGKWYNEYDHIQIHDYVSFIINQFPIFVIRRYLFCHSVDYHRIYDIAILGLTFE